jgi:uncharacterized protein YjiS (DUF1127 family)
MVFRIVARAHLSTVDNSLRRGDSVMHQHSITDRSTPSVAATPGGLATALRRWRRRRVTKRELRGVDRRLLVDLGYNPENIDWVAAELAQRSTNRPSATNEDCRPNVA